LARRIIGVAAATAVVGAAAVAGVAAGAPGVAGWPDFAGADWVWPVFSRTVLPKLVPPLRVAMIESVSDVNMKITAETVVAFESSVADPRGPNAVWLPIPPNAAAISPALPLCSSTTMMMNKQTMT
jgi:hypothetical protein